jgi:hypothetical protein
MSAAAALKAARDAGIHVALDGDDVVLEASAEPLPAVLDLLLRHKAAILGLLRSTVNGWSAEDWQTYFDERASIAEFVAGLPRQEAETRAFAWCVAEWLNRSSISSVPGRCVGCNAGDRPSDPLLPFGSETSGYAWLHSRCWPAWYAGRQAEAVAALARVGIEVAVVGPQTLSRDPERPAFCGSQS